MKTIITSLLATIFIFSCKSSENLSKEQLESVSQKVNSQDYTFVASTAIPARGKTIHLTSTYSLKVSEDKVEAYLPYFGRAYVAPMPSNEGGVKFISTDFEYSLSEKKKNGWNVTIKPQGNHRNYKLTMEIGESGSAMLTVSDNNRQSISFYGKIE